MDAVDQSTSMGALADHVYPAVRRRRLETCRNDTVALDIGIANNVASCSTCIVL